MDHMGIADSGIVGYTFQADEYCPAHILGRLETDYVGTLPVERTLSLVAAHRNAGIDRDNERTFDSDQFPKRLFADQVHGDTCTLGNGYQPGQCGDQCGTCFRPLGGECPNQSSYDGRRCLRGTIRSDWDKADPFGSALAWLFAIADRLTHAGAETPAEWGFQDSPLCDGLNPDDEYQQSCLTDVLSLGQANLADLAYFGRVLDKVVDLSRAAGMDY